jgi:hypothetical protein
VVFLPGNMPIRAIKVLTAPQAHLMRLAALHAERQAAG